MDFVWIFCCQKIWITQASNLEITKKIMATLAMHYQKKSSHTPSDSPKEYYKIYHKIGTDI